MLPRGVVTQLPPFLFQPCGSAVAPERLISPPLAVRKKQPGQWDDPTYPCRIRPVRVFQEAPISLVSMQVRELLITLRKSYMERNARLIRRSDARLTTLHVADRYRGVETNVVTHSDRLSLIGTA